MCTVHRHNKKDLQDGFSNQPSKTRASSLQLDLVSMCHRSASSDRVSVRSLLRCQATTLIHGSSVQRCSQTQLGLAIAFLETQCCNMLPHRCLVEVFRSEIARVLRALLPLQQNLFLGDVFLEPQRSRLQVSHLTNAPSRPNSTCCGSVTCHVSSQISSHVSAQVLQANDGTSSVHQSVPLAFA